MNKMASNAFKYGNLISKVTIMIFFKDFLSVGWHDLFWITKKAAKATFHQSYLTRELNSSHFDT